MIQTKIPPKEIHLGAALGTRGLWPRGTQVLKLPEQSHMEEVSKPPPPPRPSLLGAPLPKGGKCLDSSLRRRLGCFPLHVDIVESFMLFPLRLVLFGKRREYIQLWEFFIVVVGPLVPQHGQHVLWGYKQRVRIQTGISCIQQPQAVPGRFRLEIRGNGWTPSQRLFQPQQFHGSMMMLAI